MNKIERKSYIIGILEDKETIKIGDLIDVFQIERTTIYRDLKELENDGKIKQVGKGIYKKSISTLDYIKIPFFEREKKSYNFEFLQNYIPNKTSFFSQEQAKILKNSLTKIDLNTDLNTDFYLNNKRLLEITLIDLSFASSFLEGNTYDYLDTEILIKYNEIAKQKSQDDTQMILNHKKSIEYMVYYKKDLPYTKQTFFEIHSLLGDKLLPKENLGIIRNKVVHIGASAYMPLDNKFQLEEQFELFLQKLNEIKNPFEQSLFILVFIPYFQIFLDINKRTSRMISNLPLLKNNLPLISLLAVEKRDYINAILAIYELNDVSLMSKIFVENYLLNMNRYI